MRTPTIRLSCVEGLLTLRRLSETSDDLVAGRGRLGPAGEPEAGGEPLQERDRLSSSQHPVRWGRDSGRAGETRRRHVRVPPNRMPRDSGL